MREDEDHFRYYVPLLRRIIILVAVITAIPVILWTITAFVRTYVAPPKLPSFRQMTATASIAAPPVPDGSGKLGGAAPAQSPAPMVEARATATDARDGSAAAKGSPLAEPPADASPGALPPKVADLTAAAPVPAPANTAPKADTMTPMTFDAPPQNNAAMAAQQPPASTDATADALPAAAPLNGPVPLPRRRPHNLAMADLGVPMPRPRPGDSDANSASPLEWIRSIFQPPSQEQQSEKQ